MNATLADAMRRVTGRRRPGPVPTSFVPVRSHVSIVRDTPPPATPTPAPTPGAAPAVVPAVELDLLDQVVRLPITRPPCHRQPPGAGHELGHFPTGPDGRCFYGCEDHP